MSYIRPVIGNITSKFGMRTHPITKKETFHNGVDISCAIGTPIYAPSSGRLEDIWNSETGGVCMSFIDLDRIRFGFAHLKQVLLKSGDRITKGDIIAYSGNTGKSTGPHLHFTMKINGQWVDPLSHIKF